MAINATNIVLVHGCPADGSSSMEQRNPYSKERRTPSCSCSTLSACGDHVATVKRALEQLKGPIIVGHSYGRFCDQLNAAYNNPNVTGLVYVVCVGS